MTLRNPLIVATALALVLSTGAQARADQNRAIAFAANIWPNVNFLDKSSRLATQKSSNPSLRSFARAEATEQTIAANTLVAWMDSVTAQPASQGLSRRPSHGTMLSMPFRAAAEVTSGMADEIDGMQSGRSVAVDEPKTEPAAAVRLKDINLASAGSNVDRLAHLSGKQFDALYRSSQTDALTQLSTIYATYIQAGEDPGLRNFAVRQLPKIDGALAKLRSIRE